MSKVLDTKTGEWLDVDSLTDKQFHALTDSIFKKKDSRKKKTQLKPKRTK